MAFIKEKKARTNEEIRASEVRLIDVDGTQLGVVTVSEALQKAAERGEDLVEIAPKTKPPVCKIMNYGKYRYEQRKKAKLAKKKQHVVHLKEVKFRCKIGQHDYDFKKRKIEAFIKRGDKVKATIMFYGRERAYPQRGQALLNKLAAELQEFCKVERSPQLEGRNMTMILLPR